MPLCFAGPPCQLFPYTLWGATYQSHSPPFFLTRTAAMLDHPCHRDHLPRHPRSVARPAAAPPAACAHTAASPPAAAARAAAHCATTTRPHTSPLSPALHAHSTTTHLATGLSFPFHLCTGCPRSVRRIASTPFLLVSISDVQWYDCLSYF